MTTEAQQTAEQQTTPAENDAADDAAFEAGFNGTPAPTPAAEPAKDAETPKEDAPAAVTEAPAEDPWKDVPPVLREQFDSVNKRFDAIMHHLKSTDGRLGAVQNAITAARSDAGKAGAQAPTQQQIAAATTPEKWKKLEADFPAWTEALSERLAVERAAISAELMGKIPQPVDVHGTVRPMLDEFRQISRLDNKHDGWEDTIRSPDFKKWTLQGGPAESDYLNALALDKTAPEQAAALRQQWTVQFPKWWTERGALMASDRATDAIKLLDAFKEASKPQPAQTPEPAKQLQQQQQTRRLEKAVTPQGAGRSTPPALSDDDAFESGFYGQRKSA